MPANFSAFIYITLALGAGYFLISSFFHERKQDIKNILLCWITLMGLVFLMPSGALFFFLSAISLTYFCPKSNEGRALFYAAMLPAIPSFVVWDIPFPAINRLFEIDYFMLLNLTVLSAMLFSSKDKPIVQHTHNPALRMATTAYSIAIAYLIITVLLDFRGTTFTNGLRRAVETFLSTILLLLAAKKLFTSDKIIKECLFGLLIGGVFVAFIGILQQVKEWKFFMSIPMDLPIKNNIFVNIKNYRSGFMRAGSTMNPIPYGYFMTACLGILFYLRDKSKPAILFYGLALTLASGIIFSDSRAAILCLIIIIAGNKIFPQKINFILFSFAFIVIPCLFVFSFINFDSILLSFDTHGTFQYRLDLIANSMLVVADNPLLGNPNFMQHQALEASRQGQGIIDIVNAYLQILLPYGYIGLGFFSCAFILMLKSLSASYSSPEYNMKNYNHSDGLISAVLISILVLMATVSMADRLPHILWLFFAMAYGHTYWIATKKPHA